MRLLIAGCGGYIGTTLTPYLLRKGYDIRCVDWLIFGKDPLNHFLDHSRFELVHQDIRNVGKEVLKDVDVVISMSAIPNDPAGELMPELTMDINFRGRVRLAEMAKEAGVRHYILISSASVYGRQHSIVDESAEVNPLTTYARANYFAEQGVLPLASDKYKITVLRLSTVYGPSKRMRLDIVVNAMAYAAYKYGKVYVDGDGMQERPLIHVMDVSRAIEMILEKSENIPNKSIFNVGSEEQNYRILDIAKTVVRIIGGEIEFRGGLDQRSYKLNFDKIRNLGFIPKYNVADGVKQLYHEFLLGNIKEDLRWYTVKWYKRLLDKGVL